MDNQLDKEQEKINNQINSVLKSLWEEEEAGGLLQKALPYLTLGFLVLITILLILKK